jgi:hypothetical protein
MGVFRTINHKVDFCVVGGGLSGLCAAVEAARRGIKVALMNDRPMLGGNASSEIRMWVMGAHGENNQETGIMEELLLKNFYRNPYKNYSVWDSIMWEIAKQEKNITLILNCSCMDAQMKDNRIVSVTGWQTTTQMYHTVDARLFADCSGDSVLAPLSGAEYRIGHEARAEFGEDIAPVHADRKTMGMSILIQARETGSPKIYIPPVWAEKYTKEMLTYRIPNLAKDGGDNMWYMELGGVRDSIADTEELRDELLAVAYGMWDFVKNDPENREKHANFDIDWIGFLPGKRESRRYVGDFIMSQEDVRAGGKFDDLVAYGGWPMDDHHPEAFRTSERPTIFHPAPSPFGIPYRCLYSKNVENLFFAGRNISLTHVALSSTRVMCTCAILGQAVGAAAAIASRHGETPRGVYRSYIRELQQILMEDDCWLPGFKRQGSKLTQEAHLKASRGDVNVLRNGYDRPINNEDNGFIFKTGDYAEYSFEKPRFVHRVRLIFDSDLNRETQHEGIIYRKRPMYATYYLDTLATFVPKTMVKDFRLTSILGDGKQKTLEITGNHQRLVYADINAEVKAVRFEPLTTWGNEEAHVFSFEIE